MAGFTAVTSPVSPLTLKVHHTEEEVTQKAKNNPGFTQSEPLREDIQKELTPWGGQVSGQRPFAEKPRV